MARFHLNCHDGFCGGMDCENCRPGCNAEQKMEAAVQKVMEADECTEEEALERIEAPGFDIDDFLDDEDYDDSIYRERSLDY